MLEILPVMLALCLLFFITIILKYAGIIGTSLHIQWSKIVCHRTCSDTFQYSYVYDQIKPVQLKCTVLSSYIGVIENLYNNVTTSDI